MGRRQILSNLLHCYIVAVFVVQRHRFSNYLGCLHCRSIRPQHQQISPDLDLKMIMASFRLAVTISLLLLVRVASGSGVPEGWRRNDRFLGFRYLLNRDEDVASRIRGKKFTIVNVLSAKVSSKCSLCLICTSHSAYLYLSYHCIDKADELFCFGWVQDTTGTTTVGEARCKKKEGHELLAFITSLDTADRSGAKQVSLKEYDDTLIRLHFSHFKIVSPRRKTCFREEPHKCDHLYNEGTDGTPFSARNT